MDKKKNMDISGLDPDLLRKIKSANKETKVNELVEAINKDQIENIIIKSNKLKSKLLKLI